MDYGVVATGPAGFPDQNFVWLERTSETSESSVFAAMKGSRRRELSGERAQNATQ